MSTEFVHRVSGHRTERPEPWTVPGLWEAVRADGDARLNGVRIEPGHLLSPDGSHRWTIRLPDAGTLHGRFEPLLLPDPVDAENVRTLAARLREMERQGAPPGAWLNVPALVPGITEEVRLTEFERTLESRLVHLHAVCGDPRSHLHAELERVPVSRARRTPLRAMARLAAHPEDWERRTLSGIRPQHVLSVVTDERLDIYENRLAARLVDALLAGVVRRIARVRRLLALLQAGSDFGAQAGGTVWRRHRIYALWGKMVAGKPEQAAAEATLASLQRLRGRLLPLLDSPLYRGVPRQARVAGALKRTNLLTKHPHYRQVATLWRECVRRGKRRELAPSERHEEQQALAKDFATLVRLLVLHALDACGFRLERPHPPGTRDEVAATDGVDSLRLRMDASGAMVLSAAADVPMLRFVPLFASLARAGETAAADAVAQIVASAEPRQERRRGRGAVPERPRVPTVVIYPGRADERARLPDALRSALHRIGADMARRNLPPTGLLPVSLDEIEGVERVARAIRWAVLDARFRAFPARFGVPPALRDSVATVAAIRPDAEGTGYALVRRLTAEAREDLARAVDRALQSAGALGPRGRGEVHALETCRADLEAADEAVARLQVCAVCRAEGERASGFTSEGACFSCACSRCGTRWGTRECASCGERYPFLAPPLLQEAPPAPPGLEWLDHVYGADVLAEPCSRCAAAGVYLCPHCGKCGRGHQSGPHTSFSSGGAAQGPLIPR